MYNESITGKATVSKILSTAHALWIAVGTNIIKIQSRVGIYKNDLKKKLTYSN